MRKPYSMTNQLKVAIIFITQKSDFIHRPMASNELRILRIFQNILIEVRDIQCDIAMCVYVVQWKIHIIL